MTEFYDRPSIEYNYIDYDQAIEEEGQGQPGFWQELKSQVWNEIEEFFQDNNSQKEHRFLRL